MGDMEVHSILITLVHYSDGTGAKVRPVIVVKYNDEIIRTYRITSQYHHKSDHIKSHYFEIRDWYQANLKKPSWIDTVQYYDIEPGSVKMKVIGKLSDRDIGRFKAFIQKQLEE